MLHPVGRVVFGLAIVAVWLLPNAAASPATGAQPGQPVAEPAAAADAGLAPSAEPFPEFESLRGNVDFWTRVFSEWGARQVAIHDLGYPGIIYEVVDLPGDLEDRYTKAQEDFLEQVRERWEIRLSDLRDRIAAGDPLDDEDKRLALLVAEHAGSDGLAQADERVRSQRGIREKFLRGLEISSRYDAVFRQIFREAGLPEDLAVLPHVESGFQERIRSSAGAVGMWQFTKGTGRLYLSIDGAVDERLDPVAAARGAARYLADAYTRLQSWPFALTAYNHGVGGMLKAQRAWGDYETAYHKYKGRTFGFASKNFYAEFVAARAIAADPESYFPDGIQWKAPLRRASVELAQRTPPSQIALAYNLPVDDLAQLNPAWNSGAVRSDLGIPAGSRVWLPEGVDHPPYAERLSGGPATADARLVIEGLREVESIYRARRGDSLSRIASRHGMGLTELCDLNGLDKRRPIQIGQRIRIRTGRMTGGLNRERHVVRAGDTLTEIAKAYGVRLSDLLRANRLDLRATIFPGQKIQIPAGP